MENVSGKRRFQRISRKYDVTMPQKRDTKKCMKYKIKQQKKAVYDFVNSL